MLRRDYASDGQRLPDYIEEAFAGMMAEEILAEQRRPTRNAERDRPGSVGLANFRRNANSSMRSAAPLPTERQVEIDQAVVRVGRQRLTLVQDLLAANLVRPLPRWLGILEVGYYRSNETGFAIRSMDIDVRGERQVPDRTRVVHPVPATIDDFSFGARELANAERLGVPLDTDLIEQATRNVNEAIEDQAWSGLGFNVFGNTAPGVLTSPANAFVYTGTNKAWDHPSKTGAEILADVTGMIAMAKADRKPGPFNFYMTTSYYTTISTKRYSDGVTTFDKSILEILSGIPAGNQTINFREAETLPANRTALIQMTSDVIDVMVGQEPTTVTWTNPNGYRRYWMVLACMVTRIKSDYNAGAGIVVGNTV